MTKKFVVETVQIVRRKYYVEVDDPSWAEDAILYGQLGHFSSSHFTEDTSNVTEVSDFPTINLSDSRESVNAAVMSYNSLTNRWETKTAWDLTAARGIFDE